jgi:hypothetical protein
MRAPPEANSNKKRLILTSSHFLINTSFVDKKAKKVKKVALVLTFMTTGAGMMTSMGKTLSKDLIAK